MKKWEVTFNLPLSGNSSFTVEVEANTKKKAELKARKKLDKIPAENRISCPNIVSVKEI